MGLFDDKYLYETLLRYSKHFSGYANKDSENPSINVKVYVNQPVTVHFLSHSSNLPEESSQTDYKTVCRIGL